MNALAVLASFFAVIGRALFRSFTFCAQVGAMIGMLVGLLFGLIQTIHPGVQFPPRELWITALILAALALLAVLLVVGVWLRYGARTILAAALVNALLTTVLTVWISNLIGRPALSPLVGLIIGLVVGTLLCRLCDRKVDRREVKADA